MGFELMIRAAVTVADTANAVGVSPVAAWLVIINQAEGTQ